MYNPYATSPYDDRNFRYGHSDSGELSVEGSYDSRTGKMSGKVSARDSRDRALLLGGGLSLFGVLVGAFLCGRK